MNCMRRVHLQTLKCHRSCDGKTRVVLRVADAWAGVRVKEELVGSGAFDGIVAIGPCGSRFPLLPKPVDDQFGSRQARSCRFLNVAPLALKAVVDTGRMMS